jgi:hypothetical protein
MVNVPGSHRCRFTPSSTELALVKVRGLTNCKRKESFKFRMFPHQRGTWVFEHTGHPEITTGFDDNT